MLEEVDRLPLCAKVLYNERIIEQRKQIESMRKEIEQLKKEKVRYVIYWSRYYYIQSELPINEMIYKFIKEKHEKKKYPFSKGTNSPYQIEIYDSTHEFAVYYNNICYAGSVWTGKNLEGFIKTV